MNDSGCFKNVGEKHDKADEKLLQHLGLPVERTGAQSEVHDVCVCIVCTVVAEKTHLGMK